MLQISGNIPYMALAGDCTSLELDMPLQTLATWHPSTCAIVFLVLFLVSYKECHPSLEGIIPKKKEKWTSLPEVIAMPP